MNNVDYICPCEGCVFGRELVKNLDKITDKELREQIAALFNSMHEDLCHAQTELSVLNAKIEKQWPKHGTEYIHVINNKKYIIRSECIPQ